MNEWDVVNQKIEQSKIKRYNYQQILGCSLTEKITMYKLLGKTAEETTILINDEAIIKGFIDEKMFRNVKISVYSRYAEQKTAKKRLVI